MSGVKKREQRRAGYIAAIVVNIVLIYVFFNLLKWGVPFLTSRYSGVLWAIELSLGVSILFNILFLVIDFAWLRHLGQFIMNIFAIFAVFMVFVIFPFTFAGESWAVWVKVGLVFVMVATAIASIVELVRMLARRD
jgi:hypothetical protein